MSHATRFTSAAERAARAAYLDHLAADPATCSLGPAFALDRRSARTAANAWHVLLDAAPAGDPAAVTLASAAAPVAA